MKIRLHNISRPAQYLLSIAAVLFMLLVGFLIQDLVGYRVVAFLLLVTVSILALFLDILPVLLAAVLSALLWNFIFIPPRYTFSVGTTEDRWMLLMYFVVALIHAVLTFKIRQMEREVRAKEEKARAIHFYDTVFNSLSHELRTPITAIIAAADNLQTEDGRLKNDQRQELVAAIATAATRLNRQVHNLLSMSRLESGVIKIRKDWCDVRELIYSALKPLDATLAEYRLSVFAADTLPLFKLDYALMEQVLHNLVSNAIQHNPPGTDIIISADVADEKLLLTVSDTGKGFPPAEINKVFDKFYRVKGSPAGGTGLGLSIVRGFVEAHHGTVSLRNLPLSGAEFTILIPTEITYLNRLKHE